LAQEKLIKKLGFSFTLFNRIDRKNTLEQRQK